MKKILLIIFGTLMCALVIFLKPIVYFIPILADNTKPWTFGMFLNLLYSAKRYSLHSLFRRIISITKNPNLTLQYLRILLVKNTNISQPTLCQVNINNLVFQHDVQTDHAHHLQRIEEAKQNKVLTSFSPIIVVDDKIHDGHHRVDAYKKAGIKQIQCLVYNTK